MQENFSPAFRQTNKGIDGGDIDLMQCQTSMMEICDLFCGCLSEQ